MPSTCAGMVIASERRERGREGEREREREREDLTNHPSLWPRADAVSVTSRPKKWVLPHWGLTWK